MTLVPASSRADAFTAWLAELSAEMTPLTQTNYDSTVYLPNNAAGYYEAVRQSSGAQNALCEYPLALGAGTWTLQLLHATGNNRGIYTVTLGGVTVATVDGYDAAGVSNVVSAVAGVAVTTSVSQLLRVTMASKNAASSGYFGTWMKLRLTRTA